MTDIAACLQAVSQQEYKDWSVMIVDNGSLDGTVKWINENYPHIAILKNSRNLGFARANNQAILITGGEHVLLLNDDVIMDPQWLSRAIDWLDHHPEYGVIGGKINRYDYTTDELKEIVKSDIIDTTGLVIKRSRHSFDRGSGEKDRGQYDEPADMFGISGACVLYRRSALESVRYQDEYLDDDFVSYKEDVDLAWRLQRRGWKCRYDPRLLAYHHRSAKSINQQNNLMIARNHRQRNRRIAYLSYRNQWLLLFKNETGKTYWSDWWPIAWYEGKKFMYLLVSNPRALRGGMAAIKHWAQMRRKAGLIKKQAVVKAEAVRSVWMNA